MAKSRKQRRTLVGVEFSSTEIRVVETQIAGAGVVVLAAGSSPTPPKSIVEGEIVRGDAVAFALKKAFERAGIASREAVLGIPVSGYTTRSLKIPPTPPEEQAALIEGEVRHFDIVRSADGAYDCFQLSSAVSGELDMVLMAAEGHVTGSLRAVAEKAGVEVLALEPATTGMFRAGVFGASGSDGFFLALGDSGTEAAIMQGGKLRLYRRIELGTNALFSAAADPGERIDHRSDEGAPEIVDLGKREMRKGPADTLAVEVRRTIEFYEREFPSAPPLPGIRLLASDPSAPEVASFLSDAANLEVQVVRPSGFVNSGETAAKEMSGDESFRYVTAFGLALRYPDPLAPAVPSLDLYVRERSIADLESKRRTMAGSLLGAIAAVVLGIAGVYYFVDQKNRIEQELGQLRSTEFELRARQSATLAGSRETLEQIEYFSKEGIPAVWFLDNLTANLDPSLGVSEVRFDEAGNVAIKGEAQNEQSLINTVRSLQTHPSIGMAYVSSFERMAANSSNPAIRFEIKLVRSGAQTTGGPSSP